MDDANNRAALAAVGRCRLDPATCFDSTEYRAIVDKNREQALAEANTTPENKEENKKLKKKYMKQGVAMASNYLRKTLQLDVSVVDVEVIVAAQDIIETDGCLAACLLDAGCAAIIMDGMNMEALDAAKIPRDRLVAHFGVEDLTNDAVKAALGLSGRTSLAVDSSSAVEKLDLLLDMVPDDKLAIQVSGSEEELLGVMPDLSKKLKDGKGCIGIADPSATTLGRCFAACMRTDRDDGLFTTVVCTRSDEALGLVYSSKVRLLLKLFVLKQLYHWVSPTIVILSQPRNPSWRRWNVDGESTTLDREKGCGERVILQGTFRLFTGWMWTVMVMLSVSLSRNEEMISQRFAT